MYNDVIVKLESIINLDTNDGNFNFEDVVISRPTRKSISTVIKIKTLLMMAISSLAQGNKEQSSDKGTLEVEEDPEKYIELVYTSNKSEELFKLLEEYLIKYCKLQCPESEHPITQTIFNLLDFWDVERIMGALIRDFFIRPIISIQRKS